MSPTPKSTTAPTQYPSVVGLGPRFMSCAETCHDLPPNENAAVRFVVHATNQVNHWVFFDGRKKMETDGTANVQPSFR